MEYFEYYSYDEDELKEERRRRRREENRRKRRREVFIRRIVFLGIPAIILIVVVSIVVTALIKKASSKEPVSVREEVEEEITLPFYTSMAERMPDPFIYELEPPTLAPENVSGSPQAHSAVTTDSTKGFNDEMTSPYGIMIDITTGEITCNRSGKDRMVPASMTKVLTILTAARHISAEQLDDVVTISAAAGDYAYRNDCSIVGFSTGEQVTVRDLFYGTILPSGGDAAYALAEYVAGDIDSFVVLMNETVADLGLAETSHFANPVGIYSDDLYTTPYDMCMIMWAAQDNEFLHDVLEAHTYTTTHTTEHPDGITVSNWFLRRIEDKDCGLYVAGGKTGFVNESGSCAVSYGEAEDGHKYICCTGGAHSSWRAIYDHVAAYNQR